MPPTTGAAPPGRRELKPPPKLTGKLVADAIRIQDDFNFQICKSFGGSPMLHGATHAVSASDPLPLPLIVPKLVKAGTTASIGTGPSYMREDAQLAAETGTPVAIGMTNAEGSGTGLARASHVHSTPLTTKGDLLTVIAGVLGRVPVGADTFVLTADAVEAAGIKWAATAGGNHNLLSAVHPDTVPASPVRGDLLLGNSTPAWTKLAIGTTGKFLRSDGADPSWQTIAASDIGSGILALARGGTGADLSGTGGAGFFIKQSGVGNNFTSAALVLGDISANLLTYAKLQQVSAASRLLGRGDSGAGNVEEIILGTNLTMSGTTLNAAAGGGGGWTDDGAVVRLTDAADSVGVRTVSPTAALHVVDQDTDGDHGIVSAHHGGGATRGAGVTLRVSAGTEALPTAVASGHVLGDFRYEGRDSSGAYAVGAYIRGYANEGWTSARHGSRLAFAVAPNLIGPSTPVESLHLTGIVGGEGDAELVLNNPPGSPLGAFYNTRLYLNLNGDTFEPVMVLGRTRRDLAAAGFPFGGEVHYQLGGSSGGPAHAGTLRWAWEQAQTNDTTDRDSYMAFFTVLNDSNIERLRITSGGSVILNPSGSALALGATAGFTYIPSCAGTPSGVPAAVTGTIPVVFDSTNELFYGHLGGVWEVIGPSVGGAGVDPPEGSYAPGDFTVATGKFRVMVNRLELAGTETVTLEGDSTLAVW